MYSISNIRLKCERCSNKLSFLDGTSPRRYAGYQAFLCHSCQNSWEEVLRESGAFQRQRENLDKVATARMVYAGSGKFDEAYQTLKEIFDTDTSITDELFDLSRDFIKNKPRKVTGETKISKPKVADKASSADSSVSYISPFDNQIK